MNASPTIPGYRFERLLHRSADTLVHAARRLSDEQPVVLKFPVSEYPRPRITARLRREYELARELEDAGVVRALALEKYGNGTALVLEDFGGRALSETLDGRGLPLERFLELASRLSGLLGEIHARNVIHKDLKPANIIIKGDTVKIADFGIASRLSREQESARNPGALEGTLAYMSPEQTGRMNRSIDYRSDFYSLGATFYEMLTGAPPFASKDPMELVHCHIARNPPPPETRRPDVPPAVSAVVMKLLAKTAEDRYQSIFGLRSDLETCLREFRAHGRIEMFDIGAGDRSERFRVPQKLYGRESEARKLMKAFARVAAGGTELLMVSGFSGIGKTALVKEVEKPLVESRGYFAAGKFDQFKRNIPYGAVIEAVQSLIRELLTQSDDVVRDWKDKLNQAFGANGRVITDVIPEVALITGEQAPVPVLGPAEAQNRLMLMFQVFIRVLAREEHPLTLFLDDLQWADEATLKLIRFLLSDNELGHLLIIGAYRDNEVDSHHPMMITVSELKREERAVRNIRLGPLDENHVALLVRDTFDCDEARAKPLTELLIKQTRGNPFFVNEFLKSLVEGGGIRFDRTAGEWTWDMEQLRSMRLSDNVVEFMAAKIKRLPEEVRELLRLGACIGAVFDLKTVSALTGRAAHEAARNAMTAVKEGLIVPLGEGYKFIASAEMREIDPGILDSLEYKFLHDRVQQASYSLLPEDERIRAHYEIGTQLLRANSGEERIFDIVGQLNEAISLVGDEGERRRLAELNFAAGRKAKESSAFRPALAFFRRARELMPEDIWASDYETAFALYRETSQAESLVGNTDEAEALFEITIHHARSRVDKASIYKIKQVLLFDQNKYRESILTGLEGLRMFGIRIPEKPSQTRVLAELARLPVNLGRRKVRDIVHEQELEDPETIAVMGLIQELLPCGYLTNPDLLVLGSLRLANISLRRGVSPGSAYGFGVTGLVLNGALFAYGLGNEFNQLSLALLDRFADRPETGPLIGPTCMVSACFTSWPVEKINSPVLEQRRSRALEKCIDFGIFNYAMYTLTLTFGVRFLRGDPLTPIIDEMRQYEQFITQSGDEDAAQLFFLQKQFIQNLRGETTDRFSLSEPNGKFNDEEYIRNAREMVYNAGIYFYHALKCVIHYDRGDYAGSLRLGLEAEKWPEGALSNPMLTIQSFYTALAALALRREANSPSERRRLRRIHRVRRKRIEKRWYKKNPVSFVQLMHLLDAEEARCEGRDSVALRAYEAAIQHCREHEYTNYLALANELAGEFFLDLKNEKLARVYFKEAHFIYSSWGAVIKAKEMGERLPANEAAPARTLTTTLSRTANSVSTSGGFLDLNAVTKASQAISGEIKFDRLLKSLLRIVMENAGARHGLLLHARDGEWFIQGTGDAARDVYETHEDLRAKNSEALAYSVVQYVARTKEDLVLNDAAGEGNFRGDPRIRKNSVKSLLCAPILHQSNLIGIMYLENNLAAGVFTSDRLRVLKLLSSQAAISLENAGLYANLERKVEERTAELRASKKEIDDIMSNVNQGLMTVDRDGFISSEYSRRVAEIFERGFDGDSLFIDLFRGDDETRAKTGEFLEQLFNNLFMSDTIFARANPLAEYAFQVVRGDGTVVEKNLEFAFSRIREKGENQVAKVMVAIDDRTQDVLRKRELEDKAREQAEKVEKLNRILRLPPSVFGDFIREARETLGEVVSGLEGMELGRDTHGENAKILETCYREVHSLKSNARAMNLDSIGRTAHELEDVFEELKNATRELTADLKERVLSAAKALLDEIQDGASLFDRILNVQSALSGNAENPMTELENRLREVVASEAKGEDIRFEFTNHLEGEVSGELLRRLQGPLLHIVRNSAIHGIEDGAVRAKLGKAGQGVISFSLEGDEKHLIIVCEDDGAGLKTEEIKNRAIKQGIITAEQAESMSEAGIHKLIFASGLSTASELTESAGRGVGMAAVRSDLKAMNAVLMIASRRNQYTRFTIKVPWKMNGEQA